MNGSPRASAIALPVTSADDEPADQPGPRSRGDAVKIAEAGVGLAHRFAHKNVEALDVRAGGDLRHHAAVRGDAPPTASARRWTGCGPSRPARAATTAAAVSSQLVSSPSTRLGLPPVCSGFAMGCVGDTAFAFEGRRGH